MGGKLKKKLKGLSTKRLTEQELEHLVKENEEEIVVGSFPEENEEKPNKIDKEDEVEEVTEISFGDEVLEEPKDEEVEEKEDRNEVKEDEEVEGKEEGNEVEEVTEISFGDEVLEEPKDEEVEEKEDRNEVKEDEEEIISDYAYLLKAKEKLFVGLHKERNEYRKALENEELIINNYSKLLEGKSKEEVIKIEKKVLDRMNKIGGFFDNFSHKMRTKAGIAARIALGVGGAIGLSLFALNPATSLLGVASLTLLGSGVALSRGISTYAGYQFLHHMFASRKWLRPNKEEKIAYSAGVNLMYRREKSLEKTLNRMIKFGQISEEEAKKLAEDQVKASNRMKVHRVIGTTLAALVGVVGLLSIFPSEVKQRAVEKINEVLKPIKEKVIGGEPINEPEMLVDRDVIIIKKPPVENPVQSAVEPGISLKQQALDLVTQKGEGISHLSYKAIEKMITEEQLKEMASKMGVSVQEVKNHLARALTEEKITQLGKSRLLLGEKVTFNGKELESVINKVLKASVEDLRDNWVSFVRKTGIKVLTNPKAKIIPADKFFPKLK